MFKHALLAAAAAFTLSSPAFAVENKTSTQPYAPSQCSEFTTLFSGNDFNLILANLENFQDLSCDVNVLYTLLDQAHICDYTNMVLASIPDDGSVEHMYHQMVAETFVCDGEHVEIPKG